jgi:hypothetical protein
MVIGVYILVFKKPPKILLRYRDFAHLLWLASLNFARIALSTSHTYEIRAAFRLALSDERWA